MSDCAHRAGAGITLRSPRAVGRALRMQDKDFSMVTEQDRLAALLARCGAAIVDLDGTMVDTLGDFAEALNRMLRDLQLPTIAPAQIARMVGKAPSTCCVQC
ncbi:phosphoglycolate phosphatase [Alicycliphilus sp. B1]|nr:phosphoglycolate phosphatase [Alicycliphilus sp. B1]